MNKLIKKNSMKKIIIVFAAYFLVTASLFALIKKKEPVVGEFKLKAMGSVYISTYNKNLKLDMEQEIEYNIDPEMKLESRVFPFRGVKVTGKEKTDVITINPTWFEAEVDKLMEFFKENLAERRELYKTSRKKPYHMLFLVRAFEEELYSGMSQDGKYLEEEKLKKELVKKFMEQALLYAYKYKKQGRVRNPPRFSKLTKVMQPLMSVFMYGNPWLATAECYRTSEYFTKGRETYREYFLNIEVMTIIRRRYQTEAFERDLNRSVLNMNDTIFLEYQRDCARRWIDKKQYRLSKFEKSQGVKEIPDQTVGHHQQLP